MAKQHLIVIIDNKKIVPAKKYSCLLSDKTKKDAISAAKTTYEKNTNNTDYESYYFEHEN